MGRIAVKIGSNVLARQDGCLDITRMSALADQVAELHKRGEQVILISSGAVASGRSIIKADRKLDTVSQRQLYSAIGQAKLINKYYELFREHSIVCGQVLTTKESLGTRMHYLNQRNCMEVMLANGIIPIINENDTISVTELMFTDNDELSGLVATMMCVDKLIILSNIDGVYNGNPTDPSSSVIRTVESSQENLSDFIQAGRSSFGRGGMLTKCHIARKVAEEGIPVIIANGKRENILLNIIDNPNSTTFTLFVPAGKVASGVKKWIAHSEGFAKGRVIVNNGAENALRQAKATSLLLVGVTAVEGDFEKDDIIEIANSSGERIGVGCSSYSSGKARELAGCHNVKPVIHYDYLYLD